jgi:hypothetical protein
MGNLGSPMTGNFKRQLDGSKKEHLSLRELLSGDPEGYVEEGSGKDMSVRREL